MRLLTLLLVICGLCLPLFGEETKPSVLFPGGVHSDYVVKPLVKADINVDTCKPGEMAAKLASGRYNAVVVGTMSEAERRIIDAFLARGGGVLVCNPAAYPRTADWDATNRWLDAMGIRPRWEVLVDTDKDNVVRDVMGVRLSFSDQVYPPVKENVDGVLTLMWRGTTGCEPPMSFDLTEQWKAFVRGARTMKSTDSKRHDVALQKWLPPKHVAASPVLMAGRDIRGGRIAVVGIRKSWLFTPPSNCPTTDVMLNTGTAGKPSDWLQVFANCFGWLAQPSLKKGMGGAPTPEEVIHPPVKVWPPPATIDWSKAKMPGDRPQYEGLVGARTALSSGNGSVADYAKAARAAGLDYIVFLEESLNMDQAAWDKLVEQCEAASVQDFTAIPGLTYEDAQGNHLYVLSDEVKFPKEAMLLKDGRLATIQPMRSRAYFDYINEYQRQHVINGFWNHKKNYIHFADYKLYNSFPVYSFIDGKQVDDALDAYLYWQGFGGCQAVLAFEIMTSPEQVAKRAKNGWRVVSHVAASVLRKKWYNYSYSFSGSSTQYITSGPRILLWESPNRLCQPRGQWWRPDIWEFRLYLRAASDVGLKSVTVYDGDRGVLRRWLPGGAEEFEQELVLSNCEQLGLTLVVEDVDGGRAISESLWNRNLNREEFMCSDRCNFLGNARLRSRRGSQVWTSVGFRMNLGVTPSKGQMDMSVEPAVGLTRNSPTLPIDGRPAGFPTCTLRFSPQVPGELRYPFAYPTTHCVGPEIGIGQGNYILGYDPAEQNAEKTPLGHPYTQPQHGTGNAWGSWHRLIPMRKLSGWSRTYAGNWIPGTFRIGWHESDVTLKEQVELPGKKGIRIVYPTMDGWIFYRNGKVLCEPGKPMSGEFSRGTFAVLEHSGGCLVVAPLCDGLTFQYHGKGSWSLHTASGADKLEKGRRLHYTVGFAGAGGGTKMSEILDFARKFGLEKPGSAGYEPDFVQGRQVDNLLLWRMDAEGSGVRVRAPKADMPGFVPAVVEGLNDNWSAQLLDAARGAPNTRAIPVRDGIGYAMIDLVPADVDLFIGHPVVADNDDVRILVSWKEPGLWFVEAHNPTGKPMRVKLTSPPGWTPFKFNQTIDLQPGTSRIWNVKETR